MRETVLVTGYKGYVGSAIFLQLSTKRKYDAIGIDKEEVDITNKEAVNAFFEGHHIDHIIHTAAILDGTPKELHAVNKGGTQTLLEAAIKYGCKSFIFSSTFNVFNPNSSYGLSKRSAEIQLISSKQKIKIGIIRYAGVFSKERQTGVIANFIRRAKEGKDLEYVDGAVRFAYLKNVVKTNIYFIEYLKKIKSELVIHNVASFQMNLRDLAKRIRDLCNSQSKIVKNPIKIPDFKNDPKIEKELKLMDFEDALYEIIK